MISVTIQVGDAAEMRRLADVLATHFCRVQGAVLYADAAQLELPVLGAGDGPPPMPTHEDKAAVKKRQAAEKKAAKAAKAAKVVQEEGAATAPAGATAPDVISNEEIVAAVRGAMRGEGGIPAVRAALDDLGLKTALDATQEQRPALVKALTALATSDGN